MSIVCNRNSMCSYPFKNYDLDSIMSSFFHTMVYCNWTEEKHSNIGLSSSSFTYAYLLLSKFIINPPVWYCYSVSFVIVNNNITVFEKAEMLSLWVVWLAVFGNSRNSNIIRQNTYKPMGKAGLSIIFYLGTTAPGHLVYGLALKIFSCTMQRRTPAAVDPHQSLCYSWRNPSTTIQQSTDKFTCNANSTYQQQNPHTVCLWGPPLCCVWDSLL